MRRKFGRCKNAALRIVDGTSKWHHITPVYNKHSILRLEGRINYVTVCLLVSDICSKVPGYLDVNINFRAARTENSERLSGFHLIVPWAKTESYRCSYAVKAARLRNTLPIKIRKKVAEPSFKIDLLQYLKVIVLRLN
ncbi:uncharacterized protein LOC106640933 [Copidosoma floridanum]|uniref:uncharacterized protein LOC106640933 n=1 Tax=Copidosoma floridanum TaxID=29053 RepID=UPI0006C9BFB7|nr:uncharacterized protein LOC106640933 [Copidosoma floridanum]